MKTFSRIGCLTLMVIMLLSMSVCVQALDVKDSIKEEYEHEETGVTIPYRLIVPEIYDDNYKFPLVVFFHGAGERGRENERQLDNCVQDIADNMPKALILVPQCAHDGQWVDTPWAEGNYSVDEVPESDEMIAVMDLIQVITEQYSIDKNTIYAAGISMGGYAVWDAMVRHNDVFAAGVAVCGAGDTSKAELLKDTPMFVFHGTADETVPVSGSENMVKAIEAAGGTQVVYTEYSGSGHGIWGQVFRTESLYKGLKKCKLSDRYTTPQEETDPPAEFPWQPVLIGAAVVALGAVVVLAVVAVIVCIRKRSGKGTVKSDTQ